MASVTQQKQIPEPGQVVRVRTRTYLVEAVAPSPGGHLVTMACLDDDAQGQALKVVWEIELDTEILDEEAWRSIGAKGFDSPRYFGAYMHTLRWNCVTATNPRLFQSPFRAGIRIDAYQLEPLQKALRLPRVNLFIADDVGLGKTIEAGLIASELLLRRRISEIVVACPPSMLVQWQDEMETRFGLTFEILDRDYVEKVRRERGYGVNPWTTFPRFLISQRLLIDEAYAAPLRDWLENLRSGSLLILDEAHHAAPASGAKFAIDSRITRAVRDLAPRFEHRLFLSATPHNGHSNSFSALLEILDSNRFARGVKVLKSNLDDVMVRRLKEDIREIEDGFPERKVEQIDIQDLPEDAPELVLSRLLNAYREVRQRRVEGQSKRRQAEAALLISGLQQRLLSSVDAFARTLAVHRRTMERLWQQTGGGASATASAKTARSSEKGLMLLGGSLGNDDERSELTEEELEALEDAQFEVSTAATAGDSACADVAREKELIRQMTEIADQARGRPDARVCHLLKWIQEHMCPGIRLPDQPRPASGAPWNDRRLLIFTQYDDTKRYLVKMLQAAIADTELAEYRIEIFHGPTPLKKREQIKRAFNAPPDQHPVRILIATDAAREGINLQAHCHDLFHFDVPWNPSRLEQRNGRIDRKLQPSPKVFCRYFVYTQRPEDQVLRALVRKTSTIQDELGSLSQVLEARLAETLRIGIRHESAGDLARDIEDADIDPERKAVAEEELDAVRQRRDQLREEIKTLNRRVEESRKWIGLDNDALRDALSCALEMLGAEPLQEDGTPPKGHPVRYRFPNLESRRGGDPSWAPTLDTLRKPPDEGEAGFQWRQNAPIRPVTFDPPPGIDDSTVQLHLQHRVVQRLLGRFRAQGFVHHDLSRACLTQSQDRIPRVILLGRLSLYGSGATRLHEEILTVTARWLPPDQRSGALAPYARETEARTLELLEAALHPKAQKELPKHVQTTLLASLPRDITELLPHLQSRGESARSDAEAALAERGRAESSAMRRILDDQRRRILAELGTPMIQLTLPGMDDAERRQRESNRRYWQRWIDNVQDDLEREPARILNFYQVKSCRIEPIGIAYLYPASN